MGVEPAAIDVLDELRRNHRDSLDRLVPVVYRELRAIAHRVLASRSPNASLQTTALVHEAYLKLVDHSRAGWRDRAHFFALASVAMRHVLVDRAKARAATKRGGGADAITLDDNVVGVADDAETLLAIDDALKQLANADERLARIVEYRFFGGLSTEEIAEVLGVTPRTVERDWLKARMLLQRSLTT